MNKYKFCIEVNTNFSQDQIIQAIADGLAYYVAEDHIKLPNGDKGSYHISITDEDATLYFSGGSK